MILNIIEEKLNGVRLPSGEVAIFTANINSRLLLIVSEVQDALEEVISIPWTEVEKRAIDSLVDRIAMATRCESIVSPLPNLWVLKGRDNPTLRIQVMERQLHSQSPEDPFLVVKGHDSLPSYCEDTVIYPYSEQRLFCSNRTVNVHLKLLNALQYTENSINHHLMCVVHSKFHNKEKTKIYLLPEGIFISDGQTTLSLSI